MTEHEAMCDCDCDSSNNSTETALSQAEEALAALEAALRAHDGSPRGCDAVAAALMAARAPCAAADEALQMLLAAGTEADTTRAVREALQMWQQHEQPQSVPTSSSSSDSSALEHEVTERLTLVQHIQTLRETLARNEGSSKDETAEATDAHKNAQSVDSIVTLLHTQTHRIDEALAALEAEQTHME